MTLRLNARGLLVILAIHVLAWQSLDAASLPVVTNVAVQPLTAQVRRLLEATDFLGSPLSNADKTALEAAMAEREPSITSEKIQKILDPYCLFGVNINAEMRVKVAQGPAKPELVEQGWRQFLVKVENDSGTNAALQAVSPNAISLFESGSSKTPSDQFYRKRGPGSALPNAADLWLDLMTFDKQPLKATLSGLNLEYRIVQLYS